MAIQEWTGSVVVGPIDVMGRSCAGIPKSRQGDASRAVVISAHGSLDRLCWCGVFSSVDRSELGIGCLRGHIRARMGIPRARGSLDQLCWRGVGLGRRLGWPSLGGLAERAQPWLRPGLAGQAGLGLGWA